MFSCRIQANPPHPFVEVRGEIDLATAGRLRFAAMEAMSSYGPPLRLDLSRVTFMGIAGLTVLEDTRRYAESIGGQVVLRSPSRAVTRLLTLARAEGTFPLSD